MLRFLVFLSVVLAIYAVMHSLVWWMALPLFEASPRLKRALLFGMLVAIASPCLVFAAERTVPDVVARVIAWMAFTWMGVVFLAFSMSVILAAGEVVLWGVRSLAPGSLSFGLRGQASAAVILSLTAIIGVYGLFEARALRVERVQLTSPKLASSRNPLRLVLVSDLHLGLIHRERTSRAVIEQLEGLRPDALLVAGDFVDARLDHRPGLARMWEAYRPPLGKFAVVGNHEIYPGLPQSLGFLQESGFRVLRNEGLEVEPGLTVVGVDDDHLVARDFDRSTIFDLLDRRDFTVLLQHRPTVDPSSRGRVDLQVSGHAHRGQIFPFSLLTGLAYPLQCGLHDFGDELVVYTSRGTGTWGPPLRVLSPPEITLFEITAANPSVVSAD